MVLSGDGSGSGIKTDSSNVISRVFPFKFLQIHITSISYCLWFTFKICQIVVGTSMIRQFHKIFWISSHFFQVLEKTKGGGAGKAATSHQPIVSGGSALTQITPGGGGKSSSKKPVETSSAEVTLSSIMESEESENDSAVILDELASPTSKSGSSGCVSRSVSDVMSSEAELEKTNLPEISPFASPNYRGFLLRHGSYERYKIRSRMQQIG